MKWNIFKRWRERREQRRRLKGLQRFSATFGTLDVMEQKGLLVWDVKSRRLFIDASLATLMMGSAKKWTRFVGGLHLWTYNREAWASTQEQFTKAELQAVRDYMQANPGRNLSRGDIDRIREARRLQMVEDDIVRPKVEPFEFFIVAPPSLDDTQSDTLGTVPSVSSNGEAEMTQGGLSPRVSPADPVGRLVAVGYYEPETNQMDLATWEEVRSRLGASL